MRTTVLSRLSLATAVAVSLAAAGTASADNLELRLATLAPAGSSWMKIPGKGSAEIGTKTEGRVKVKYYPGGVQGDERDVVRKINLGQLDGAAVTSVGLSMVDESIRVLELPRMRDLFTHLCKNGFEHHVAMVRGHHASGVGEAGSRYLQWNLYHHSA